MAQTSLFRGEASVEERSEIQKKEDEKEKWMRNRYGEPRKNDKGVPWACECSAAILVTTSHDPNTRGEKILSCPYEISDGRGQGCGFMHWWIPACQDEFVKIRDEKNGMKEELEKATTQIEAQEALILDLELKVEELMKDKKKQAMVKKGVHFDTAMGVVNLMDKVDELEKKYQDLSMKYDRLNQYL